MSSIENNNYTQTNSESEIEANSLENMVLPYKYFKSKTHITELQKLKDKELFFIIRLFNKELKIFKSAEGLHLEGLNKACIKMKNLFNEIRFILNNYENVIYENDLTLCQNPELDRLLTDMDKIELELKKIRAVKKFKRAANILGESCLINIRIFYSILSDFIFEENRLW